MSHHEGHYNREERSTGHDHGGLWTSLRSRLHASDAMDKPACDATGGPSLSGMLLKLAACIIGMYMAVFVWGIWWCRHVAIQREEEKQRQELVQRQLEEKKIRQEQLLREQQRKEQERRAKAHSAAAQKTVSPATRPRPARKESPNQIAYLRSAGNIGTIPANAYAYCRKLWYVDIECSGIGRGAFLGCTALEKVMIRGGLTKIESKAFVDCPSLTIVLFPKTLRTLGNDIFEGTAKIRELSIPSRVSEQLCGQMGDGRRIQSLYILTDTFFNMPQSMKDSGLDRSLTRLYVPDALLVDFCKDHDWILFGEILPLSRSKWYDAQGLYKDN